MLTFNAAAFGLAVPDCMALSPAVSEIHRLNATLVESPCGRCRARAATVIVARTISDLTPSLDGIRVCGKKRYPFVVFLRSRPPSIIKPDSAINPRVSRLRYWCSTPGLYPHSSPGFPIAGYALSTA